MTFAADVKAQNVVVVPEGLVIFLFGRVEQQVNLGGRKVVGPIVGRVGLWTFIKPVFGHFSLCCIGADMDRKQIG